MTGPSMIKRGIGRGNVREMESVRVSQVNGDLHTVIRGLYREDGERVVHQWEECSRGR